MRDLKTEDILSTLYLVDICVYSVPSPKCCYMLLFRSRIVKLSAILELKIMTSNVVFGNGVS
jgi:hypothetical protein